MWRHFFGPAARIIGIDYSAKASIYEKNPMYGSPDRILVGDQGSAEFWRSALEEIGGIDAILDDGGHRPFLQNATLHAVWPKLRDGGVYMVEDLIELNRPFWTGVLDRFVLGADGMHSGGMNPDSCQKADPHHFSIKHRTSLLATEPSRECEQ